MRRDPYAIDMDRRRNYYSYKEFGHLVWNCRNWEIIGQGRRLEYKGNG